MEEFCNCSGWLDLNKNNYNIFQWDPTYGWILHWIELTEEEGYTQVHRYGIPIKFCPMCSKSLKNPY